MVPVFRQTVTQPLSLGLTTFITLHMCLIYWHASLKWSPRTRLDNLIFTSPESCAFHMKLVLILI